MKTDRFAKVMLVIIAGLLLLNCFKDNGEESSIFSGTKVEASVPTFIQVGKSYNFYRGSDEKIIAIDKESG